MSNIEQIDFSTLIWVKKELDETLNRAQAAIEEYVENPEDENQLQFCATYLHQVQGTLKMVELYGAAMVAEEMEQVAKKILEKEVDSEKDAFEVLMRGIILLPDYLERIQLGYKDIPMVLLPLVNDLRTVKGDQLLSESALFNPDLSLGLPSSNLSSSFKLSQNQLSQVVKKIRSNYQICLLNWLKEKDVKDNLKKIQIIVDKLKTVITPTDEKQLFWVAGGLFEALISGGLEKSVTVKQLAARLDQAIRMLTVTNENETRPYKKLTKNLLYYVALADKKDRRINEIQKFFNLSNFISDDVEIEHAQSSLSGKNRELLESVTSVIKEDLMNIQENLDLYNRNENATTADLESIAGALSKISDTLGIIGIGVARSRIIDVTKTLDENIKIDQRIDKDTIMQVAETLLYVESSLDENILSLGEIKEKTPDDDSIIPKSEMKKIMDILAKESINNLQKIKQNFVQYIEAPWNKESIETSPKLLKEISGALKMSGFEDVATEIDRIENYTTKYMLESDYKPSVDQLDMLAESVASLEYYLEYLSNGINGDQGILNLARSNIDSLLKSVESIDKNKKDSTNLDADLDQMSDDEFELDLDLEADIEDESELDDILAEEGSIIVTDSKKPIKDRIIVSFSDETDDDIKEVFLEEFEEELEHLNSIYPRWKSNPDEQVELLSEIRRIYHTLKGSGRLVGTLAIGDFSWKIEEMTNMVLNKSHDVNDSYILVMQSATDILPGLYEALKNDQIVPVGYYRIIDAAEKVMNGETVAEDALNFDDISHMENAEETTDVPEKVESEETNTELELSEVEVPEIEDDIADIADEFSDDLLELDLSEETDESLEVDISEEIDTDDSTDQSDDSELNLLDELEPVEELVIEDQAEEILTIDLSEEPAAATVEDDTAEVEEDIEDLSVDPVFVEILQQEVEGHLSDIQQYINDAKENDNYQSTEKFIRVIHTLNGAANMASVNSIVEMTTPLEIYAKLSNELNRDFDSTTIDRISDFRGEAIGIMKDLANKSEPYTQSSEIGSYFSSRHEQLEETIANEALETENDDAVIEFDLSEFLDDKDGIATDETEREAEYIAGVVETKVETDDDTSDDLTDLNIDDISFEDEELVSDLYDAEETASDLTEQLDTEQQAEQDQAEEDQVEEDQAEEEQAEEDQVEEDQVEEDQAEEDQAEEDQAEEGQAEEDQAEEDQVEEEQVEEDQVEEDQPEEDQTEAEEVQEETPDNAEMDHIAAVIPTSYDHEEDEERPETQIEFDEELLEIFKEEADDILDRTEHVLSDLEEDPEDADLILALQRDLHTLKGGSRMAGLHNIGDLSHVLESLLEIIGEENRPVDKTTLNVIHDSFDMLNRMKGEDDFGQTLDIDPMINKVKNLVGSEDNIIPEESKLDQDYLEPIDALESVDVHFETPDPDDDTQVELVSTKKKSNVLSGNQIKVNSELLDNLVNYAGEVSIYRSRLEQEVGSFRVNLSELGNTVARIKEQLRKLDVETETQIMSTFQKENDDEGFDPLEMDRFSQLQQLSRSLAESVSDLTSIHSYLDDVARTSDNLLTQQSRVNTELQEGLMETRLVSFNSIVPRLRRLVRTTSKELEKPVKLEVRGAEGEMDKTVLEGVIAPLEHMLRNALAHGIEKDRSKQKKPNQGSIIIDVRREATEVVISVADDGAGINRKKIRKLALEKGIIKKGARIKDENLDKLILHSGFSTVEEVSKLAGRGVGMDVVSNQINLLGGSLDISSELHVGTKFDIRLPYTLALSSALLVEISETIYAIPVSGLEGIIRMSYPEYQQRIQQQNYVYQYANEDYQIHELDKLLDIDSEVIVENNQIPLVMIRSGDQGVALRVDKILGSREIVVKTVGSQISSVPGIYGATILGDGNVVLILDIIPLSRSYITKLANLDEHDLEVVQEEIEKDPIIMIVDDSITMRKVGERILRRNSYDVLTAKDGIDALEHLKEVIPDVMLLDIEMPRMDGYELAIEMKKEDKYAHIPIIMITSRTGEKHRQKAMDLGVDRYLGKPYQEADLLENISDLIEDKKG
jgi:chemosensory pili system protein ChpA (sensor histidine kinase/response regulator)